MIKIDMWYGDKIEECEKADCQFYDLDTEYRGNLYKNGRAVGDFSTTDSVELEKIFPGIFGK